MLLRRCLSPVRIAAGTVGIHSFGEVGCGRSLFLQHQILGEERAPTEVETIEQHLLGWPAAGRVDTGVFGEPGFDLLESGGLADQVVNQDDTLGLAERTFGRTPCAFAATSEGRYIYKFAAVQPSTFK